MIPTYEQASLITQSSPFVIMTIILVGVIPMTILLSLGIFTKGSGSTKKRMASYPNFWIITFFMFITLITSILLIIFPIWLRVLEKLVN